MLSSTQAGFLNSLDNSYQNTTFIYQCRPLLLFSFNNSLNNDKKSIQRIFRNYTLVFYSNLFSFSKNIFSSNSCDIQIFQTKSPAVPNYTFFPKKSYIKVNKNRLRKKKRRNKAINAPHRPATPKHLIISEQHANIQI